MTLAKSQQFQPTVALQLRPQQSPRPQSDAPLLSRDNIAIVETQTLVVEPGAFRSVMVLLKHNWRSPLKLHLNLQNSLTLPAGCFCGWHQHSDPYQLGLDKLPETSMALPQLTLSDVQPNTTECWYLFFYLPKDFFESSQAVTAARPQLKLDYPLELRVEASGEDFGRQLANRQAFSLQFRPLSLYFSWLPGIFQANDFLERFIKILEEAFSPTVTTHGLLWAYLDPRMAPEALLPFLAHWVGWQIDPRLTTSQNRQLIRHAVNLYRWHGTRAGLRLYLHLYTGLPLDDAHIEIQEVFNRGFRLGNTELGIDSTLGAGRAYHFTVVLRPPAGMEIDEPLVQDVIERCKPAFCTYNLAIAPPVQPTPADREEGDRP
ncbi:phage tail protein [Baaleninema simplex]|uniref:phage tail protein n=1 Tax=Baaleninema simplex TaxID=2862350 RepID=UPI00034B5AAE|nr:phage tail protein [Baaleninema simplex]